MLYLLAHRALTRDQDREILHSFEAKGYSYGVMMKATAIVVLVFILGVSALPTATATNSGEHVSEFSEPGETYSVDRD